MDKQEENISGIQVDQTAPEHNLSLDKIKSIDVLKTRLKSLIDKAEDNYIENYESKWAYFENDYNAVREKPEGMDVWRSNSHLNLPFNAVQDEMPQTLDGLIGDGDFFAFNPRPGKEHLKLKGEAWSDLVRYFYDKANFFSKTHDTMLNAKKFGIGYIKQTWYGETKEVSNYAESETKSGEPVVAEKNEKKFEQGLKLEVLDVNRVFPDPDAESMEELNECGYLPEYAWVTRDVVEGFKGKIGANVKEINAFMDMADEKDPYERYKLFCIYTAKEVYWLTGNDDISYLIRKLKNPYDHGRVPVYTMLKFKRPGYIIGTGVIEKLADISNATNDWFNLMLDNAVIAINKVVAVKKDTSIDPVMQNIQPGSMPQFDNPREDAFVLPLGDINPSSFPILESLLGLAKNISGSSLANTSPQKVSDAANMTATVGSIMAYGESQKTSLEVKINRDSYLKPLLRDGVDLIKQYITDELVKKILPPEKAVLIDTEEDKSRFWDDFDFIIKGETGYIGQQKEAEKLTNTLKIIPAIEQVAAAVPDFQKDVFYSQLFRVMGVSKDIMKFAPQSTKLTLQDYTPQEQEQLNKISQAINIPVDMIISMLNEGMTLEQIVAKAQEAKNGLSQPNGVQQAQQPV